MYSYLLIGLSMFIYYSRSYHTNFFQKNYILNILLKCHYYIIYKYNHILYVCMYNIHIILNGLV